MRRRSALLASLLLTGLVVCRLAAQAPAPAATRKALFWKATSKDNVAYLLGSIHFGSKSMYPLPKEIEDAFAQSSALIVELDINHVDMPAMMKLMLERGMYSEGDNLWNHISPETRGQLEKFCTEFGLPVDRLATMKPWMVSVSLASVPLLKNGMVPDLGIDKYFLDKAKDKRIVELESADWQMKLLSGFPDSVQEKSLTAMLKDADKAMDLAKKLQENWIAGDVATLEKQLTDNNTGPPEVMKAMLQDRNPHMADVAEEYLKGKEVGFVVVGAAHLVGKDGVVSLLEKRGYKVEQVALKK